MCTAYTPIAFGHIQDEFLRYEIFNRASMLLGDVHAMLSVKTDGSIPGCGWASALVLVCILDGMARHVYPTKVAVADHEKRFKRLVTRKLHWSRDRRWFDIHQAADVLYKEVRNPLVHELARDVVARGRPKGYLETVIGKWGSIDGGNDDIDKIELMTSWNPAWPIICVQDEPGGKRLKLASCALYWATKDLVQKLANDKQVLADAVSAKAGTLRASWGERMRQRLCERLCH